MGFKLVNSKECKVKMQWMRLLITITYLSSMSFCWFDRFVANHCLSQDNYLYGEFYWNPYTKYWDIASRANNCSWHRDDLDLWPRKPLQQCPLTLWISVPSFVHIPPQAPLCLKKFESCGIGINGRTDGQPDNMTLSAYYCCRRHNEHAFHSHQLSA